MLAALGHGKIAVSPVSGTLLSQGERVLYVHWCRTVALLVESLARRILVNAAVGVLALERVAILLLGML